MNPSWPAGTANGGPEPTPECPRGAQISRFPPKVSGDAEQRPKIAELCLKIGKIQHIGGSALNNDKGKIASAG